MHCRFTFIMGSSIALAFRSMVAKEASMKDLALKVVKSWLDTMMENGWIPREQNRGAEREFLCSCPRFMKKDIRDGNPPTLILALDYLLRNKLLTKDSFPEKYWQKL